MAGLMVARYAIETGAVVVPARVALLLERELKLNEFRRQVRGQDRQVDEVLSSWHAIAMLHVDEATSAARGSSVDPRAEAPAPSEVMTARDVADLADCTAHAVRLARRDGRLAGERTDTGWRFRADDVAAWLATRRSAA